MIYTGVIETCSARHYPLIFNGARENGGPNECCASGQAGQSKV